MPASSRRRFLQMTSSAAAATTGFFSSQPAARGQSSNERPRVAVVGCGGQGTGDGRQALAYGDIVAVCDVDTAHTERAKKVYTEHPSAQGRGGDIAVFDDYRAVIDSKDLDADGNPTRDDEYNVPHRFTVHAGFPGGVLMEITSEGRNGILVEGTKGRFFVNRGTISGTPIEDLATNPLPGGWLEAVYGGPLVPHMQNFFDCIASRKKPASDVWTRVAAINTCHLSNIAIRLNRKVIWDAASQSVKDDTQANRMLSRDYRKGYEIEL